MAQLAKPVGNWALCRQRLKGRKKKRNRQCGKRAGKERKDSTGSQGGEVRSWSKIQELNIRRVEGKKGLTW